MPTTMASSTPSGVPPTAQAAVAGTRPDVLPAARSAGCPPVPPALAATAADAFLAYLGDADATNDLAGSLAELLQVRRGLAARRRAAQRAVGS